MSWAFDNRHRNSLRTRRVRPSHKKWKPHGYQKRAREFLLHWGARALFLDPGLGKTSIVLSAFKFLKKLGYAEKMLVIAPLRVCQLVWRQEGQKWTQFRDLKITLLHGANKGKLLKQKSDIYLINPEGVSWLMQQYYGRKSLPFDIVCIDELTKFKNTQAKRFKALKGKRKATSFWWGLTGSPAPNGYIDLFGQILILDDGRTFGKYITYFRDQYFKQDWTGHKYALRDGADKDIEDRLGRVALRMASEDYLTLPQQLTNVIEVSLSKQSWDLYRKLEDEMIASLPEGVVTAANSAALYAKLSQLANGAIYLSEQAPGTKKWAWVHDEKLDALEDLIDDLQGQQLLIAYEFQHDLPRIRERLEKRKELLYDGAIPSLTGVGARKAQEIEDAWNSGEIRVLLVHPASAGHGLNLQESNARHICWFSQPWDLEQWIQTILRILRQGNLAKTVTVHILRARGTIDELKGEAIHVKDTTQTRLLDALNQFTKRRDFDPSPFAVGRTARSENSEDDDMAVAKKKLGFRKGGKAAATSTKPTKARTVRDDDDDLPEDEDEDEDEEDEAPARKKPKGWGGATEDSSEQRTKVKGKISRKSSRDEEEDDDEDEDEEEEEPASSKAKKAFPKSVREKIADESEDDEDEDDDDDEDEDDDLPEDDDEDDDGDDDEDEPEPVKEKAVAKTAKRGRGRPPGAKTRNRASKTSTKEAAPAVESASAPEDTPVPSQFVSGGPGAYVNVQVSGEVSMIGETFAKLAKAFSN